MLFIYDFSYEVQHKVGSGVQSGAPLPPPGSEINILGGKNGSQIFYELLGEIKINATNNHDFLTVISRGFGGLDVACWPLVPKFAGSNPAEAG